MCAPAEWPIRWTDPGVAAEVPDVVPDPGDRRRPVLDEAWEAHLGIAPVVEDDRDEAA